MVIQIKVHYRLEFRHFDLISDHLMGHHFKVTWWKKWSPLWSLLWSRKSSHSKVITKIVITRKWLLFLDQLIICVTKCRNSRYRWWINQKESFWTSIPVELKCNRKCWQSIWWYQKFVVNSKRKTPFRKKRSIEL